MNCIDEAAPVSAPFADILGLLILIKTPITTVADHNLEKNFHCFSKKIKLDISGDSSARQRIHMKHQASFLQKISVKK